MQEFIQAFSLIKHQSQGTQSFVGELVFNVLTALLMVGNVFWVQLDLDEIMVSVSTGTVD